VREAILLKSTLFILFATLDQPVLQTLRLTERDRVVIDGELNEDIWRRAVAATDFLQRDPDNGAPATERTEVRVVFDGNRMVLGNRRARWATA
jgi:hypothetical protein